MYIEWAVKGDQKWHWKEILEEEDGGVDLGKGS
jgi:hypothetical protein